MNIFEFLYKDESVLITKLEDNTVVIELRKIVNDTVYMNRLFVVNYFDGGIDPIEHDIKGFFLKIRQKDIAYDNV